MRAISLITSVVALQFGNAATIHGQIERHIMPGDRIAVYNLAGTISVERGRGSSVVVEITRVGQDAARLTTRKSVINNWSVLNVLYPSDRIVYRGVGRFGRSSVEIYSDGTFGLANADPSLGLRRLTQPLGRRAPRSETVRIGGAGGGLRAHADLRILVPPGKNVAIHLGVGAVQVGSVTGDLQIDARSGSVTANGTRGLLRIDTGSGRVNLQNVAGQLAANTGSGDVSVTASRTGALLINTGSGEVQGTQLMAQEANLRTGSGSITLDNANAAVLRATTGSGNITVTLLRARNLALNTGSGEISAQLLTDINDARFQTGSGGVEIILPATAGAEIVAETGSGGIDVDIPIRITEQRRSYLRGIIGDGNGRIQIETASGGITLQSR